MEKTRYKTEIAGNTYTIIGTETKHHMDMVTKLVDDQLSEIKKLAPGTTNEQAAILTALNAMSDQLKKQEALLSLQKEVETLRHLEKKVQVLEEKIKRAERVEEKAKEALQREGKEASGMNHVQARQILNEEAKKKIRSTNQGQKNEVTYEQSSLDLD